MGRKFLASPRGEKRKATLKLRPDTAPRHPVLDYTYLDCGAWTDDEIERFYTSLCLHGKEFHKISKHVKTKTTSQCVQYFYVWKKPFPAKYARIRSGHSKLHKQCMVVSPQMQPTVDSPHMQPTAHSHHMQSTTDSPQITRGSARRLVAAAAQRAVELAEAGKMGDTDVSAPLQECLSQPHHGSCPHQVSADTDVSSPLQECLSQPHHGSCSQQVSTDTVLQANCESVPNVAVTSNCLSSMEDSPTYFCSKQKLNSHVSQHKKRSKFSPHTPSQRTVNGHIATPSPVSDHSTEAVFPCSQCDGVFLKIKSRNAHMKCHKTAQVPL